MNCYNYVSEKDVRKCRFYVRYMESKGRQGIKAYKDFDWHNMSGNADEICYWINNELDYFFSGDERDIEKYVSRMKRECNEEILSLTEFDWFKNDKRICLWLWHQNVVYSYRRGDTFPDHRGRFNALIEYYDSMDKAGSRKRELLNDFKGDWQRKGNTPDPFVSESVEIINYLWKYAAKLDDNITRHFTPISDDDKKVCLTGYYDCILDTREAKELFLMKIKNGLSSYKHRKKSGEGNINKKFLLSLDNDKKLNDMIAFVNMKRDDFMNRLIAEEYERRKNTSGQS